MGEHGHLLDVELRPDKRDGVTLWFAAGHPRTPWYAKALGAFVVAYALSPIDLIPDFIPVLGYVDDVLLLPAEVRQSCRQQADDWMCAKGAKPRSRFGIAFVLFAWACVGAMAYVLLRDAF